MGVHTPVSPLEIILGSIVAACLVAYLVYAILRPERF
ncbi:MAG: K(+)-transporting ATPase subunit F [Candidatus Binataceae bacterium]